MSFLSPTPGGVLIRIKAVPGASRNGIAGILGDRLKVRISAPPEGGKANAAICALLARTLSVKPRDVTIQTGLSSAEKVVFVAGATVDEIVTRL
jgi:uncharacterized protein